ncbi:hypothetical protein GARC_5155 [Paraglaciecola arctica BSs20135]|uniref:Uncharacterized protein n=1 Tax=Paraglaciecola arctica BSs20135 TaxID=493475 RepID=K6ZFA3_9ALTE|nr:hypothetical protein GARC_5155 [Paraglaciecola arctica BSs20135]
MLLANNFVNSMDHPYDKKLLNINFPSFAEYRYKREELEGHF